MAAADGTGAPPRAPALVARAALGRRARLTRGRVVGLALATAMGLAPWTWFAVRDRHPYFDAIAAILPWAVPAAVVFMLYSAALLRSWRCALGWTLSCLLFSSAAVGGPARAQGTGPVDGGVRIAATNVLGNEIDLERYLAELADAGADIVAVSETGGAVNQALRAVYPYARSAADRQPAPGVGGRDVAIYSTFPITSLDPTGARRFPGENVRVEHPDGPFILSVQHPRRPGFDMVTGLQTYLDHDRVVRDLRAWIDDQDLPVILAGDLNSPDRSAAYRTLANGRLDAMREQDAKPTSRRTSWLRALDLRIDHIIVPADWCSDDPIRLELTGSDHWGVVATVGRCAEG